MQLIWPRGHQDWQGDTTMKMHPLAKMFIS
jgi:hypothetical protein